jgi:hypothetical protein
MANEIRRHDIDESNVVLRGLTIVGQGGNNGIVITAGPSLTVENCVVNNFTGGTVWNPSIPAYQFLPGAGSGIHINTAATATSLEQRYETIPRAYGSTVGKDHGIM